MMKRLRGLKSLVVEAVDQGSRAIEKVQIETAKVPFNLAERIPGLKVPASGVRVIYNTGVSNVHGMIRLVNKVAGDTVDAVLDTVDKPAGNDRPSGKDERPAGTDAQPDAKRPAGTDAKPGPAAPNR